MINFCHIVPNAYLQYVARRPVHLLLAHLIEENEQYRNFYQTLKEINPSVFYHVDNSAFEMYKRGLPMYDSDKLIEMASLVKGDSIVMSDYPKQPGIKTIESAMKLIPKIKEAGFRTFFCPQSQLGDIDDLLQGFKWALNNPRVDYIGVSILSCPIALGVNESSHGKGARDETYRMQRFLSRWRVFTLLEERGLLVKADKRFHCLGMTDGPHEVELLKRYRNTIFSWDSSSAVWHGIHGIRYDQSPTGLRQGKYEEEVDFDIAKTEDINKIETALYNMRVIDEMCK